MSELARLRAAAGLTQQQLADKANTSQPQIKRLEDGDRKLTKEWAKRLAPHLGTTAAALMFPPEEAPTSFDRMYEAFREVYGDDQAEDLREDWEREIEKRKALLDRHAR